MSSTTRLLVLGVVRIFQPVHGYVVQRELASWRAEEWASVRSGSIYNALKSLATDGFLEIVGTDQVGGRPERTTYRLTAAGVEEHEQLLRETLWKVERPTDPLMAAIAFLGYIKREEAIAALENRTQQIKGMVAGVEFKIAAMTPHESPPHVKEMLWLANARVASEIAWAEAFAARLRAGEYATAGDPQWMDWAPEAPKAAKTAKTAKAPKSRRPATQKAAKPKAKSARAKPGRRARS